MTERTKGRTETLKNKQTTENTNKQMNERTNGQIEHKQTKQTNKRTNEQMKADFL